MFGKFSATISVNRFSTPVCPPDFPRIPVTRGHVSPAAAESVFPALVLMVSLSVQALKVSLSSNSALWLSHHSLVHSFTVTFGILGFCLEPFPGLSFFANLVIHVCITAFVSIFSKFPVLLLPLSNILFISSNTFLSAPSMSMVCLRSVLKPISLTSNSCLAVVSFLSGFTDQLWGSREAVCGLALVG